MFAPIYSMLFAVLAIKCGEKANAYKNNKNFVMQGVFLLTAMFFSLGLVMYYVQITWVSVISVSVPLIIIGKFVTKKKRDYPEDKRVYQLGGK
jgi:membrane protein insertase Oxa1/YidC/SpoIIIJ